MNTDHCHFVKEHVKSLIVATAKYIIAIKAIIAITTYTTGLAASAAFQAQTAAVFINRAVRTKII